MCTARHESMSSQERKIRIEPVTLTWHQGQTFCLLAHSSHTQTCPHGTSATEEGPPLLLPPLLPSLFPPDSSICSSSNPPSPPLPRPTPPSLLSASAQFACDVCCDRQLRREAGTGWNVSNLSSKSKCTCMLARVHVCMWIRAPSQHL